MGKRVLTYLGCLAFGVALPLIAYALDEANKASLITFSVPPAALVGLFGLYGLLGEFFLSPAKVGQTGSALISLGLRQTPLPILLVFGVFLIPIGR
jgi:hypothetical protein